MQRSAWSLTLLVLLLAPSGATAAPRATPDEAWGTNGEVHAVAAAGTHVFLGGDFSYTGPNTGSGIAVDQTTGALPTAPHFPHVEGEIRADVSDGNGGWFIGGDFTQVGSTPIQRLAHIKADGSLDTGFTPPVPSTTVDGLALGGTTLYVVGGFDNLSGTTRNHAAAVSATTGALTAWNPNVDQDVYTVATSAGDSGHVWLGGRFTTVGGQARTGIAQVVTGTGAPTSFAPALTTTSGVLDVADIAIAGGSAYAVGNFEAVNGAARGYGAAFALDTGAATGWDPHLTFNAEHVTAGSGNVYISGGPLKTLYAVDGMLGDALPGFANPGVSGIYDIALRPDGARLYVTDSEPGEERGFQSFNAATGALDAGFTAEVGDVGTLDGGGQALATDGANVFIGGGFRSVGGVERDNLAALDATTGAVDPDYDAGGSEDPITALATTDDRLLLGTYGVSALGLTSGVSDGGFSVSANGPVRSLAVRNGRVYLGGGFDTVDNQARKGVAAVSPATGALDTGFASPIGGDETNVYALTATDTAVYVGGRFTVVGGVAHNRIAALDPATGAVTTGFTAAATDGEVSALLAADGRLYVGGTFSALDGATSRRGLGAVDPATGALDSGFDPQIGSGYVYALGALGTQVYAGGDYESAGGASHTSLATLNATTGAAVTGAPADVLGQSQDVEAITTGAGRLITGGAFDYAGGAMRFEHATFSDPIPQNVAVPTITGTVKSGVTVNCTTGAWTSAPTSYAYEWRIDGSVVATGASYAIKDADGGKALTCRVTAANANGASDQAISAASIVAAPPANTSPPTIETALTAGDTAHCDHGTWTRNPTSYNYQWSLDGSIVAGAAATTYATSAGDAGKALRCLVSAVNAQGTSLQVATAPTTLATPPVPTATPAGTATAAPGAPGAAPVNTARPVVTRPTKKTATVKDINHLDCSSGTWTGADPSAYEYQWFQDGLKLGTATTNRLDLNRSQLYYGASLACQVVANGPGGDAVAVSDAFDLEGTCGDKFDSPAAVKNDPNGTSTGDEPDPCSQGSPAAPSQAEPVDTRLPLACQTAGGFSYLRVKGCFTTNGTQQTFTGNFTMNGLDFKPVLKDTDVTFDSKDFTESLGKGHKGHDHFDGRIYASDDKGVKQEDAQVEVFAGPVMVYKGPLDWDVDQETGSGEFELASFDPPKDADVEGFPILAGKQGEDPGPDEGISLKVDQAYEAKLDLQVSLPFILPDILKEAGLTDISGSSELVTNPDVGLTRNSVKFTKKDLWVGGLHLSDINAAYSDAEDLWEGGLTVSLPFEGAPDVKGDVKFQHGTFKGIAVDVSKLNVPVFPLVFLQELRAAFEVNPLFVGGGAALSIGKAVEGVYPAGVDGNLSYRWPSAEDPGKFHADGKLSLFDVPFESAYFDYFTDDFFDFGFRAEIGLPDFKSDEPHDQPVYIGGGVDGWVQWPQFSVHGQIDADLNFVDLSISAQAVASSKALAVCGDFLFFSGGASYTWATEALDVFGGCDLGPFEVARPPGHTRGARVGQVDGSAQVALPAGGQMLKLTGTTGAPHPVITGPDGQSYSAPLDGKPLKNDHVVILTDPKDKTTFVAVKDSKGTWTLTPPAGTPAIATTMASQILPDPRVKASVTGKGTHRRLHWSVTPAEKGQELKLVEQTKYGSRLVLDTKKSKGSKRFVPGPGDAGTRTFQATVINAQGQPRGQVADAGSYRAPFVPEVARVRRVKAKLKGRKLTVTWAKVKRAATYIVTLKGKGLKVGVTAGSRATFPNLRLGKRAKATVTVRAMAVSGKPGAVRRKTVRLKRHR